MKARAAMDLGTVAGIPLRVHVSWIVALFFMTSSLSVELATSAGRFAPVLALGTVILLFAALVAHELGHALVARRCGVSVSAITLFVFGGAASLESEPRSARDELCIAVAGPLVSVALAVVTYGLARISPTPIVHDPLEWLARVNLGIALFNMLPGFPLDGGRILRAVLWAWRRDVFSATTRAARMGRGIAYGMISLGLARALLGWSIDGVWMALVGCFLLSAARAAVLALPRPAIADIVEQVA
jgi:Zn-dependent protease